jgi:hypothetical protein
MDDSLKKLAEDYVQHKHHIKVLEKMAAEEKKELMLYVQREGTPDDVGHTWAQVGPWSLQVQRRQGEPRLDKDAAIEWAKAEGFWDKVSSTIEVLDEDKLMSYAFDNREDNEFEAKLKELYVAPKPTFAFQTPVEDKYNDY